ncbi:FKBP-type peptidyl-prolyl cis-trans isomerase [Hyalangium rubrum]|uniref:Peptidyl-prolyl cis-trans isomerase n=1 Tax=Hyalangium rubrum TaxID=3103134 RepID=A0ABU5GXD3_9BACT|nr:FKBP-type peptidyl-prolyl cis-trans isomerase [Hyalangium sp. s54d21]MDY7225207.1 FKBP-type peptidyl-prolyl cis-trans isomerase [Hyalangium sp. s54d21]
MNVRSPLLLVWLLSSACATTSDTSKPAESSPATASQPQTEDQKTLYALGLTLGRSISVFNLTPEELEYVRAGIYAQQKGETPAVDIQEYGPKLQALATSRQSTKASGEKEKSKAYLDKVAQEVGSVKTESGLIYQELKGGTGTSPTASDEVTVHYRGTLINGEEFDNSYKRGEPASFPLGGVIPCWTEGVQRMKVGGKARLVCPSDLAYGDRGAPPDVPGGAALIFEIELLDIAKEAP